MDLVVIGAHSDGRISQMLFDMVSVSVVEHAFPMAVLSLAAPS